MGATFADRTGCRLHDMMMLKSAHKVSGPSYLALQFGGPVRDRLPVKAAGKREVAIHV